MREFNYSKLLELNIPANMYDLIAKIYEYKGKQEIYVENFSDVLEKMVEVAKIQSTKSSNAIEGISTNDGRLEELMKKKMNLIINNETKEEVNIEKYLEKVIREVLKLEDIDEKKCEISLSFVDEEKIRQLNKDFRSIDRVTDVLSFPIEDFFNEDRENILEKSYLMLGDVVICLDVARKQADDLGHSFEREVMYLTCHSILHLLGYDHIEDDDKKIMRAKEKEVMKNLGVFK